MFVSLSICAPEGFQQSTYPQFVCVSLDTLENTTSVFETASLDLTYGG